MKIKTIRTCVCAQLSFDLIKCVLISFSSLRRKLSGILSCHALSLYRSLKYLPTITRSLWKLSTFISYLSFYCSVESSALNVYGKIFSLFFSSVLTIPWNRFISFSPVDFVLLPPNPFGNARMRRLTGEENVIKVCHSIERGNLIFFIFSVVIILLHWFKSK